MFRLSRIRLPCQWRGSCRRSPRQPPAIQMVTCEGARKEACRGPSLCWRKTDMFRVCACLSKGPLDTVGTSMSRGKPFPFLNQVRAASTMRHDSRRTEEVCLFRIGRLSLFHGSVFFLKRICCHVSPGLRSPSPRRHVEKMPRALFDSGRAAKHETDQSGMQAGRRRRKPWLAARMTVAGPG